MQTTDIVVQCHLNLNGALISTFFFTWNVFNFNINKIKTLILPTNFGCFLQHKHMMTADRMQQQQQQQQQHEGWLRLPKLSLSYEKSGTEKDLFADLTLLDHLLPLTHKSVT